MATIKDVAREAAVSVATVSRVFNDSGLVSDKTRRHVRAVASRLNYWPNGVARSLITNRTHALGVLMPDLYGEFFSEVIRGIDLAARKQGLHLLVSSSHSNHEEMVAALRSMRGRIDGLILMAPEVDAPAVIQESAVSFPLVLLEPGIAVEGVDTISIANGAGARAMVRHLIEVGHRRIATITGPLRNIDARERLEGWRTALREAGIDPTPDLAIEGDFTEPSGYAAGEQVLRLSPRPTAVFAGNDYMAVGLLGALSDAGVRVPEDVAVTGFDDIALARYLNPPLTTVHVDAFRLGEHAVSRLAARAPGDAPALGRHDVLVCELIVRASCGAKTAGLELRTGRARAR